MRYIIFGEIPFKLSLALFIFITPLSSDYRDINKTIPAIEITNLHIEKQSDTSYLLKWGINEFASFYDVYLKEGSNSFNKITKLPSIFDEVISCKSCIFILTQEVCYYN